MVAPIVAGCDTQTDSSKTVWQPLLTGATRLTQSAQQMLLHRHARAQEFGEADITPQFPVNGTSLPESPAYQAMIAEGFAGFRLVVDGLVQRPQSMSLAELRALPSRTQITRHDCVEGWSAIGRWTGAALGQLLQRAAPTAAARYVVFHCADTMDDGGIYYESLDLAEAYHPQTILAYDLNRQPLPVANGAPLRLRAELHLGYKMAKYVTRVQLVDRLEGLYGGRGGYWEDRGYDWWAGI